MRLRKPRLRFIGHDWNAQNRSYRIIHGETVIQSYLDGKIPTFYSRWDQREQPIYLNRVVPNSGPYPENITGYARQDYWRRKAPQNLTNEDKSYLRWLIRKGRLPDSPTKDPGL